MHSPTKPLIVALAFCFSLSLLLAACSWGEEEPIPTPVSTLSFTLPTPLPTLPPTAIALPEPTATLVAEQPPSPLAPPSATPTSTDTTAVLTSTFILTTGVQTATVAPRVFFRQPTANAILPLTSTVVMGVAGLVVEPAGGSTPDAGHMHLLIDTDFIEPGDAIPKDEQHLHLGDGTLAISVTLTPGEHTLRLQFADTAHLALAGDQYRAEIKVFVVDGAAAQAVRFVSPSAGAVASSPVEIVMAATGLVVEPTGEIHDNAGHLHILVDSNFIAPGDAIPQDDAHLHYGQGQITTTLELAPGEHTLRLQFANGAHIALEGEQYRAEIQVTVE